MRRLEQIAKVMSMILGWPFILAMRPFDWATAQQSEYPYAAALLCLTTMTFALAGTAAWIIGMVALGAWLT